jgi:general secretion pathway protein G
VSRSRGFNVFLPWERKRTWLGRAGRARMLRVGLIGLGLTFLYVLRTREEHASALRATRASIANAYRGTMAYRAEHAGACPKSAQELSAGGYTVDTPNDAWGRPIRIVCPGLADPKSFELVSDGPDGRPFGLDRVE